MNKILKSPTHSISKLGKTVSNIRQIINNPIIRTTFETLDTISIAVHPFFEKPGLWTASKSFFNLGSELIKSLELWGDEYFDRNPDWILLYTYEFSYLILDAIKHLPVEVINSSQDKIIVKIISLTNDTKIGWVESKSNSNVRAIWVNGDKEIAKNIIKQHIWNKFGKDPIVMFINKFAGASTDNHRVNFTVDESFHTLPSLFADKLSTHLGKCIDANVFRSVMLYGPPGTGKSTIARKICQNLNMTSLRIKVEDIPHLETEVLFSTIELFKPDVIIFDDYDRSNSQEQMLEVLEFFQKNVKLVIATANNISQIDKAILRPGRFDELHFVNKLDEIVVRKVLGEFSEHYEDIKDWPIAFIHEYVKRLKFMSPEDAKNSMIELTKRVNEISDYSNQESSWASLNEFTPKLILETKNVNRKQHSVTVRK